MSPTLVLVRRGVYPTIRHLQNFTKSGSTVSPIWIRTQFPSSSPTWSIPYYATIIYLRLRFSTSLMEFSRSHISKNPSSESLPYPFFSFTPVHLLGIWHHCFLGHESYSWGGLTHNQLFINHCKYHEYDQNDPTKSHHQPHCWFPPFQNTVSLYIDIFWFWYLQLTKKSQQE